jgi:hypothetical protein
MDKENVVHIHKGILFSHDDEILSFEMTWMRLGGIMLHEKSQIKKN